MLSGGFIARVSTYEGRPELSKNGGIVYKLSVKRKPIGRKTDKKEISVSEFFASEEIKIQRYSHWG